MPPILLEYPARGVDIKDVDQDGKRQLHSDNPGTEGNGVIPINFKAGTEVGDQADNWNGGICEGHGGERSYCKFGHVFAGRRGILAMKFKVIPNCMIESLTLTHDIATAWI